MDYAQPQRQQTLPEPPMFGYGRKRQEEELEAAAQIGREVGREIEAERQSERPPAQDAPLEEKLTWKLLREDGPSRRFEARARVTLDKFLPRAGC